MKSRKAKTKGNRRLLKWVVGLEVAAIGIFIIVLTVLFFGSNFFHSGPISMEGLGLPELSDVPQTPTVNSFAMPIATLDPLLPAAPTLGEIIEFDPSTANKVVPDDILEIIEEVSYYGLGGDGPDYCNSSDPYTEPKISRDPHDAELMELNSMFACGWEKDEVLEGTIQYPDGRIVTHFLQTEEENGVYFGVLRVRPWITDPAGIYTFILKGKKGSVISNAYYRRPSGPRLVKVDDNHLFLSGFFPNEKVRLFHYREREKIDTNGVSPTAVVPTSSSPIFGGDQLLQAPTVAAVPTSSLPTFGGSTKIQLKLTGWQEYQMDQLGQLIIKFLVPRDTVLVFVGNQSGELQYGRRKDESIQTTPLVPVIGPQNYLSCPSDLAALSRLQPDAKLNTMENENPLFANARRDARVIENLPITTEVSVRDGPYCADNLIWWSVSIKREGTSLFGYLLEYDGQHYYLEP